MFKCFVLLLILICFAFIGVKETYYKIRNRSRKSINNAIRRNRR